MLQSMTGYGEAVYQDEGLYYSAQIRTVNNKFLKSTLKLPDNVTFLEEKIEKMIRENLTRGTVYFTLQMKSTSEKPLININTEIIKFYVEQLNSSIEDCQNCTINASSLLNYPGVVEPYEPDEQQQKEIEKAVCKVAADAIENLKNMRKAEGEELTADLLSHCGNIANVLEKISEKAPVVVNEYREKLEKRVNDLLKSAKLTLDEQMLIREVAVFADRCDISEEIARLRSHLNLFDKEANSNQSVGRRLDFLCQEMFREVNTIGSKASDSQICQWVVDMKCSVDRIKEQVQNVE
ncbi:MAG: YicC/YloC family endoribonuclease [Sedimentisphaeraceae bacterium JB056]